MPSLDDAIVKGILMFNPNPPPSTIVNTIVDTVLNKLKMRGIYVVNGVI